MPYISAIERIGEARGKAELLSLLLAQQVGTISMEMLRHLKNCRSGN